MKLLSRALIVVAAALFAGCATPPQEVQDLQSENTNLRKAIRDQQFEIKSLTEDKSKLESDLAYCTKRSDVLDKEKAARVDEATAMRKGVREFTDQVMNSLQTYFERAEIVDYIGSELFQRASADSLKNIVLVDMKHAIESNGTVIGGRAYLNGPTRLQFCLVRKDEADGRYAVAAITPPVSAADAGIQSWTFEVPMAARKGDLIGVYVLDDVTIPYDDADTGEVLAVPGPAKMNTPIAFKQGDSGNKRAYSFGVVGYFDTGEPQAEPTALPAH